MEGVSVVASDGPDIRLDYMGSFVQKSLKLKPEKWARVLAIEEHKTVLKEFADSPLELVLVIVLTQNAQIIPTLSFPLEQLKSKGISKLINQSKRSLMNYSFYSLVFLFLHKKQAFILLKSTLSFYLEKSLNDILS